jgi:hypothetical protein
MFDPPEFKVGDEVAFRNMCQPGMPPFKIQEVDCTLFGDRYKCRDKWWSVGCFMPYKDWKRKSERP